MPLPRRHLLAALPPLLAGPPLLTSTARAAAPDLLQTWHDPARDRDIPVRIRLPDTQTPAPLVIISHGLGGSRNGLAYLGAGLAAGGFAAVHLQHHGSDSAVWRDSPDLRLSMAEAVLDPRNALHRLRDVIFALDHLPTIAELRGRLDLTSAAIAGHSFGAWTVTHMLGEALPGAAWGIDLSGGLHLPEPRLAAGIALSPVPPIWEPADAFARIRAPILHITGTNDRGYVEAATPQDRTIPYRRIAAPGVLAVLDGATHASFAGEPDAGPRWNDPTYQPRTAGLSLLFLRAVLHRDAAAAALLLRGGPLSPSDRIDSKGDWSAYEQAGQDRAARL